MEELLRLNDLLQPERAARKVLGLCAIGFVVLIIGSACARALAGATIEGTSVLWLVPGLALASLGAYLVRERRMRADARSRNTRGAERTPLLPRMEEEE